MGKVQLRMKHHKENSHKTPGFSNISGRNPANQSLEALCPELMASLKGEQTYTIFDHYKPFLADKKKEPSAGSSQSSSQVSDREQRPAKGTRSAQETNRLFQHVSVNLGSQEDDSLKPLAEEEA